MMAVESLVIESGTLADLDAVLAIDAAAYPSSWSRKLVEAELTRDDRHHLVARLGSEVIGHGSLMTVADEGHITTIAVDPDQQGRGVAKAIMLELCQHARATGLVSLTLEVRAGNRPAHALYRRFGFAPVGARPGYYAAQGNAPREDALIMWAHHIQSEKYAARLAAVADQQAQNQTVLDQTVRIDPMQNPRTSRDTDHG